MSLRDEVKDYLRNFLLMSIRVLPEGSKIRSQNDSSLLLERGHLVFTEPDASVVGILKRGVRNQCFMNAARAATDDPMRYVYMEGYAVTMGIPVHHGWLYDMRTKRIVDNTWKEQGEAYYGIAVSYETLVEAMNATGVYGIFFTGFLLNRVFNDNEIINLPIGEKIGYTSPLENHSA